MAIGLKIKELMSKEKIDAPTLAKKMGKTKQAIYDMLEKEDLNTSILRQLSCIFKVPIYFFLTDEKINEQEKIDLLKQEIDTLKQEIKRLRSIAPASNNDRLYELWMQFMKNQAQHQDIMKEMASIYKTIEE